MLTLNGKRQAERHQHPNGTELLARCKSRNKLLLSRRVDECSASTEIVLAPIFGSVDSRLHEPYDLSGTLIIDLGTPTSVHDVHGIPGKI
jgi:hypothetical protein